MAYCIFFVTGVGQWWLLVIFSGGLTLYIQILEGAKMSILAIV